MSRDKSWAQTETFRSLMSLVNELWFGTAEITQEEFEQRVNEAYADGELTGTQYDKLIGEIRC